MRFGKSRKNGKKSKKSRTTVCIIITAAIFAGFAIRLVDWQLVQGKSYKSLAAKSTGYTEKTDATRGEIVDRNGVGLVVNTTKYKIVLNKLYIEEDRLDGILLELADILTKTGDTRTDSLPISVVAFIKQAVKKMRKNFCHRIFLIWTGTQVPMIALTHF